MGRLRVKACHGVLPLLLPLLLQACSGHHRETDGPTLRDGGGDDGTGLGGSADGGSGSNGGAGSSRPATAGARAPAALVAMCPQRCAAAQPPPSDNPDCPNSSLSNCTSSCIDALADTDEPCARCKLEHISWLSADGGCSEWECVCWDGDAEFPDEQDEPCAAACESTLTRRARTRMSTAVPSSIGRAPDALVELSELAAIGQIAIGGDDGVWVTGMTLSGDMPPVWLVRLDDELSIARKVEPPAGTWPGRSAYGLLAAPNGDALIGLWTGEVNRLARFAPDGSPIFELDLELEDLASGSAYGLGWTPAGNVLVTLLDGGGAVALRAAADGSALGSGSALAPTGLGSWRAIGIDAQGRFRLGGTERATSLGGPGVLIAFDNTGSEQAPQLNELTRTRFVGNENEGSVLGFATHADGSAAVFGWLREDRRNAVSHLIYSAPFVARLAPDGTEEWRFEHTDIIDGSVHSVALDGDGNVYAVGSEDPVEYAAQPPPGEVKCAVYGCDGLVVRKWSASGELLWEYQHREATSAGYGLALDSRGRLFVAGGITREARTGVVLRFDPND